jgi:hypothetical protein
MYSPKIIIKLGGRGSFRVTPDLVRLIDRRLDFGMMCGVVRHTHKENESILSIASEK